MWLPNGCESNKSKWNEHVGKKGLKEKSNYPSFDCSFSLRLNESLKWSLVIVIIQWVEFVFSWQSSQSVIYPL